MAETITQMTCEELTAAYVILRDLDNVGKTITDIHDLTEYISLLKELVVTSHELKLEDMRREFLGGTN